PGSPPQGVRGLGAGSGGPQRIVILVSVLLVCLRNDAAGFFLLLALLEHEGVLGSGPFLKGSKTKPGRAAILMFIVNGVAGGEVMVGVEADQPGSSQMSPDGIAIAVEIVSQVPGDIGKCGKTIHGVADEAALVGAEFGGMDAAIVHIEDEREDDIAVSRELYGAVKFLPAIHIETAVVETRGVRDIRQLFGQRCEE